MTKNKHIIAWFVLGVSLGISLLLAIITTYNYTSSDAYCQSCHIHTKADESWLLSSHVNNESGVTVHCVDCHLPRKKGFHQWKSKVVLGVKDVYSYLTKDSASIDWDSKQQLEYAVKYIPNESCKECHTNLFPKNITDEGVTAHLYYTDKEESLNLQCISCHLDVGHVIPNYTHKKLSGIPGMNLANKTLFTSSTSVQSFESFTEQIPGTPVSFSMKAIPGGTYKMGSTEKESFRKEDEGPVREVTVSPFFMAEIEVTWDQYWAFYAETFSEGRTAPEFVYKNNSSNPDVDGISGPTPPFGFPDQGWGGVDRPAITMTYYAAETFCQWLTKKTGKLYRLPTEAEWEYAARGGTQTPYFFEGNPKTFSSQGFLHRFFDPDTAVINRYVVYQLNSKNKSKEPSQVAPNPFGLKNMLGNVMEYCSDYYQPDAYAQTDKTVKDPKGPATGEERVVRGGYYALDASEMRCAARDSTRHEQWLRTDPQQPKSIWWYSDIKGIGFRVVCEKESALTSTVNDTNKKQ